MLAGMEVGMYNSIGYIAQVVGLKTTTASKASFDPVPFCFELRPSGRERRNFCIFAFISNHDFGRGRRRGGCFSLFPELAGPTLTNLLARSDRQALGIRSDKQERYESVAGPTKRLSSRGLNRIVGIEQRVRSQSYEEIQSM